MPLSSPPTSPCRCGWDGTGEHLCHRCHQRPGTFRLYNTRIASLAGVQMKFVARDTHACNECWDSFRCSLP